MTLRYSKHSGCEAAALAFHSNSWKATLKSSFSITHEDHIMPFLCCYKPMGYCSAQVILWYELDISARFLKKRRGWGSFGFVVILHAGTVMQEDVSELNVKSFLVTL